MVRISREGRVRDFLLEHPERIEEGLTVVGKEVRTSSGRIDLLFKDKGGKYLICELKTNPTTKAEPQVNRYAAAYSIDKGVDIAQIRRKVVTTQSGDKLRLVCSTSGVELQSLDNLPANLIVEEPCEIREEKPVEVFEDNIVDMADLAKQKIYYDAEIFLSFNTKFDAKLLYEFEKLYSEFSTLHLNRYSYGIYSNDKGKTKSAVINIWPFSPHDLSNLLWALLLFINEKRKGRALAMLLPKKELKITEVSGHFKARYEKEYFNYLYEKSGSDSVGFLKDLEQNLCEAYVERMRKKGITKPVILKSSERPAKYSLSSEWKLGLVKE